jgi:membrane protein YqaA with SNARE-associated domain
MDPGPAYVLLFGVSFLAATVFPAQSELVLAGMLLSGNYYPWLLILVATLGNTAGACVNWGLGRSIQLFRDRRWFPLSKPRLDRAERWYARWGIWSLLLSWAPMVGDALTVLAGAARVRFGTFVLLVGLAKGGRYLVLAWTLAAVAGEKLP